MSVPPEDPSSESPVESGTFEIDRAQAVEKLSRYQLADPETFLLSCVRCAVASGASEIRVTQARGRLVMRFDGRPLDGPVFEDPLAGLFGQEEASRASRHLAVGLLAALRLEPDFVDLYSGEEPDRRRVRLLADLSLSQDFPILGKESSGTVLRIEWNAAAGKERIPALLGKLRSGYGMTRTRLNLGGRTVPAFPADGPYSRTLEKPGLLACVKRLAPAPFTAGRLRLYHLGAFVEEVRLGEKPLFDASVDDERFSLSLSASGVVRDERFAEALRSVEEEARRLPEPPRPWYRDPAWYASPSKTGDLRQRPLVKIGAMALWLAPPPLYWLLNRAWLAPAPGSTLCVLDPAAAWSFAAFWLAIAGFGILSAMTFFSSLTKKADNASLAVTCASFLSILAMSVLLAFGFGGGSLRAVRAGPRGADLFVGFTGRVHASEEDIDKVGVQLRRWTAGDPPSLNEARELTLTVRGRLYASAAASCPELLRAADALSGALGRPLAYSVTGMPRPAFREEVCPP